VGHPGL